MRLRNTHANWGAVAKSLHWIVAILVLTNLGLGYWADELPRSPEKAYWFYWHKTIGLTVLWLMALRVLWRLGSLVPPLPPATPAWQRIAAGSSHFLLYLALFAMPISGWIVHSAADSELVLYGLFAVPDIVAASGERAEWIGDMAGAIHYYLFMTLAVLIGIHVLGALKHAILDGDDVLKRMLPFSRASDPIRGE
ncbi:MAG: cytochrome b [Halofilum sp. (in: g-proteobacteria)]|nr:cytochrome b [Halofilum sp. (in: g-proteobacteria)]